MPPFVLNGRMTLPLELPIDPMLASAVDQIPTDPRFVHEPKWDGFRCIVSRDGEVIALDGRGKKSLTRYFPEVVNALSGWLPDGAILDGELIVRAGEPGSQRLDWDALSARIHPAASRIALLSEQTPAELVFFDALALDGRDLTALVWQQRREQLETVFSSARGGGHGATGPADLASARAHPGAHLSAVLGGLDEAIRAFESFEGAGLDGIVSKPRDSVYQPGKRGWKKTKHSRTAEAVVIGYRVHKRGHGVGSLLLGMYDASGTLLPVGGIGAFSSAMRDQLVEELEPLVVRDESGEPVPVVRPRSRFSKPDPVASVTLRPELVAEVAFDQLQGVRFRHAVTLLRFRPDRDARSCLLDQVERAPSYDLAGVLTD